MSTPPEQDGRTEQQLSGERIDAMEAGREMDALVAERVLGWSEPVELRQHGDPKPYHWSRAYKNVPGRRMGNYRCFYDRDGTKVYCGKPHDVHFPERYSTDIADAWKVVEAMRERGCTMRLYLHGHPRVEWSCGFEHGLPGAYQRGAPTAPLAICRAALAALSHESAVPTPSPAAPEPS